jgi:peptide/nickel transport system substrate-binding protein
MHIHWHIVIVITALLAACARPAQEQAAPSSSGPMYGGTLAVTGGGFHLDPHQSNTANTFTITSQVYNWLLRPAAEEYEMNSLVGDLAERWEPSADGKSWTFYLRKGVKWHDGSDFTARDVKASFDRVMRPPDGTVSPRKAQYSRIQNIEIRDDHTIVFSVDRAWPELLYALADAQNPILPAKIIETNPKFFLDNMMGTGPFKLQTYRNLEIIELVRNPDYWDTGKPYLDGITFTYVADAAAAYGAFQTGQLTGPLQVPPAQAPVLKSGENAGNFKVWDRPQSTRGAITFGTHRSNPFQDIRVRKAVNLAFDRSAACTIDKMQCQFGGGGFMMESTPWYLPDLDKLPMNQGSLEQRRTQAKALLAEAGHPNGFTFDLNTRSLAFYQASALWVVDQLKTIGITANLKVFETANYYEYLESGNFDASFDYWASTWPTPDDLLNKYFVPGGGQNYSKYDNPRITDLLQRQSQTLDQPERIRLVNEAERLLWDDLPQVPIGWYYSPIAHYDYVHGYFKGVSHYNQYYYSEVWLDGRFTGPRNARS